MFREGHYLEVIRVSEHCAATAVVTVQEKTVEIKKKKVSTNKWLNLEDWAALYDILEKALLRNGQNGQHDQRLGPRERRKCTHHLEVTYAFEASEDPDDRTSLPTIRVKVSPAKKRSGTKMKSDKACNGDKCETAKDVKDRSIPSSSSTVIEPNEFMKKERKKKFVKRSFGEELSTVVEEYVPNVPMATKAAAELNYIPSRKSTLQSLQHSTESNEYVPSVVREETTVHAIRYIPNSIPTVEANYETYEPSCNSIATIDAFNEYVPNSKGSEKKIEEYQPDFTSKSMKFDDSYVPSSSRVIKEFKRSVKKSLRSRKVRKQHDERQKEHVAPKKSCSLASSCIKEEI